MSLLSMSLSGGCVIFAAMLLRALALNHLPRQTFSTLWGVAWLRLMLPIRLPSRLSMLAQMENLLFLTKKAFVTIATSDPVTATLPADARIVASRPVQIAQATNATISAPQTNLSVWMLAWLLGALICISAFAASYLRWRRVFQASTIVDNAFTRRWLAGHPLRRGLCVRQSAAIRAPLTYGILHPVILLPVNTDWQDEETLTCVFAHEFVHICRFDALTKPLLALAPCVHWFNPLVWAMWILANRDIELACDGATIRRLGAASRRAYALALLRLEEQRDTFTLASSFSRNATEERIGTIMKMRKMKLPALLLAILLVFSVTAAFATTAPENKPIEESDTGEVQVGTLLDDVAMTEIALERLATDHPEMAEWVRKCYPDAVWWTAESYAAKMQNEQTSLRGQEGQVIGWNSGGVVTVTPELIDSTSSSGEEVLSLLTNGWLISKSIGGDENLGVQINPRDWEQGMYRTHEYELAVWLNDGTEAHFGPYDNAAELLAEFTLFALDAVASGKLNQDKAREIIAYYAGMI